MTELVTFGETPLRFSPPDNQRLEMARSATIYADGLSSNVAIAAHELGAETAWLSKLPETPLGRRVVTQIEEHGVDTEITWTDDPEVRQGILFREAAQDPRSSQYWHDRSATASAAAEPSDYPMNFVQDAEMVFTDASSFALSQQAADTTHALLRAANGGGGVTAVDLNYASGIASPERYRELVEQLADEIDILFADETAVRSVLDRSGKARELANVLSSDFGLDIVAIRRSGGGAVTLHNSPGTNVIHERESIEADPVDETGDRGAFIGGFLEELIRGADAARALTVAVATAALQRTIEGPFLTTTTDEIEPIADRVIDNSQ